MATTYTLNDWFGACLTAAGTGVLLNNEMGDFTAKADMPNLYGLMQDQANAIAPGKLLMVVGTPVGRNRVHGANDPRRNTGLAAGH